MLKAECLLEGPERTNSNLPILLSSGSNEIWHFGVNSGFYCMEDLGKIYFVCIFLPGGEKRKSASSILPKLISKHFALLIRLDYQPLCGERSLPSKRCFQIRLTILRA